MGAQASATRALAGAAVAAALAVGTLAVAPAGPATAATDPSCRVVNVTSGASHRTLAAAVKAARNGNKLLVRGTCRGATTVSKRLVIEGRWSRRKGAPTLRSNGKAPVVTIAGSDVIVSIKKLTVRGDPTVVVKSSGAGIKLNYADGGVLKLVDTKVKDLRTKGSGGCIANFEGRLELWGKTIIAGCIAAAGGGGIHNESGKLVVAGQTVIKRNRAKTGGGISGYGNFSNVKLRSEARVADNRATHQGGGIYLLHGVGFVGDRAVISGNTAGEDGGGVMVEGDETDLTLAGSSRVSGNSATYEGGGVMHKGRTLTMTGSSSITGNSAALGGGVNAAGWITLVGVVCPPDVGANVTGNSPDDCHHG